MLKGNRRHIFDDEVIHRHPPNQSFNAFAVPLQALKGQSRRLPAAAAGHKHTSQHSFSPLAPSNRRPGSEQ